MSINYLRPYSDSCSSASLAESESSEDVIEDFRLIIHHPFIRNHPVAWLFRFDQGDTPIEEAVKKIYCYVQTQNDESFNLSENGEKAALLEPPSDRVISYRFFLKLYDNNKQIRKENYKTDLGLRRINKRNAHPSDLLYFAARNNYWEKISSLVMQGGVLDDSKWDSLYARAVNRAQGDLSVAGLEWIGAYKEAYKKRYESSPLSLS